MIIKGSILDHYSLTSINSIIAYCGAIANIFLFATNVSYYNTY